MFAQQGMTESGASEKRALTSGKGDVSYTQRSSPERLTPRAAPTHPKISRWKNAEGTPKGAREICGQGKRRYLLRRALAQAAARWSYGDRRWLLPRTTKYEVVGTHSPAQQGRDRDRGSSSGGGVGTHVIVVAHTAVALSTPHAGGESSVAVVVLLCLPATAAG